MLNYTILKHKEIIKTINNSLDEIIIFGLSQTTISNLPKLTNKNIKIVDNNKNLHNGTYNDLKILAPSYIESLKKNYLIIVWGYHCEAILNELKLLKTNNILLDFNLGGYRVNSPTFVVELPPIMPNKKFFGAQNKFALNFIEQLALLQIPTITQPITKININKKYTNKDSTVIISYHTIGENLANIYRYKESYLKDYITFDTDGFSGWHSSCKIDLQKELKNINLKKAKKFYDKLYSKYVVNNISKYKQSSKCDIKLPKRFVFFPMQVTTDVVSRLSNITQNEAIKILLKKAKKDNFKILIKKHPKSNDVFLHSWLDRLEKEKKIILYDGSIHKAISKSIGVLVSNSAVGFEALIHLKPIVSFGKSEYQDLTYDIKDFDKIYKKVSTKKANDIKQFLYYYLKNHCININKKKDINKIILDILLTFMKDNKSEQ